MGQGDRETVQIHTEGGRALARALRTNTSLCCVNLRLNRLGDEGGRAVVDAVRHHPRLERLDLSHNGLAALSAKALGKCLPLNGILREVELLGNSLGAEGGALVRGALEAAPALEVCSLGCCGLADSDLQAVQVCLGACSMLASNALDSSVTRPNTSVNMELCRVIPHDVCECDAAST